jgi:hypothetical protein
MVLKRTRITIEKNKRFKRPRFSFTKTLSTRNFIPKGKERERRSITIRHKMATIKLDL